ncbi:unnamed protein product [Diatraea saccharalis]|uniref:Uncharacterized protein n=1 Tax=Diatraea saccharalis TaxID=40085 RepID=A0A9N9R9L8_9NEOP|nr:unnamed protein product [Diatraea saccharalis]
MVRANKCVVDSLTEGLIVGRSGVRDGRRKYDRHLPSTITHVWLHYGTFQLQSSQKLNIVEKEKRKNNLIFFGIQELGKTEIELVDYIKDSIEDAGVHLNSQEIANVQRIGRWTGKKNRPVVVSFCLWKKHLVMKNKTNLPQDIYIKEDFPKEVLEKRRQLKIQADEERKKGNIAFIKYDKLMVKTHSEASRDKRKREDTSSPKESQQKKTTTQTKSAPQPTKTSTNTIAKPGILNYVERTRSASLSALSKN